MLAPQVDTPYFACWSIRKIGSAAVVFFVVSGFDGGVPGPCPMPSFYVRGSHDEKYIGRTLVGMSNEAPRTLPKDTMSSNFSGISTSINTLAGWGLGAYHWTFHLHYPTEIRRRRTGGWAVFKSAATSSPHCPYEKSVCTLEPTVPNSFDI
ncbi:unnamed protein product [Protopolystoma xenopodis]|uniref:Uncharacterized protein n=1 Tax=Protopolystoma xenopodis TaxID=117903 RepID=A0A448WKD6_9PLAT|nr:unnamed protein product [Protopolystoma xenopodis]